jgi:hypothetical protein
MSEAKFPKPMSDLESFGNFTPFIPETVSTYPFYQKIPASELITRAFVGVDHPLNQHVS